MDKSFKEENYKRKKKKINKDNNTFLIKFILIFVIGYLFFFTSKVWLPKAYEGVEITPIGTTIELNNRNITVDSWEYAAKDEKMEIIVEIDNFSIDGIKDYIWSIKGKGVKYKSSIVKSDGKFYVLEVYDVKKDWTEVSLNIDIKEKDKKKVKDEFTPVKIYTNDKVVKNVADSHILSLKEYKIKAYKNKILITKDKIRKNEQFKDKCERGITEASGKIAEIKKDLQAQTEDEQNESKTAIENLENEKEGLKDKIIEGEKENKKLEEKIKYIQGKIDKLNGKKEPKVLKKKNKKKTKRAISK